MSVIFVLLILIYTHCCNFKFLQRKIVAKIYPSQKYHYNGAKSLSSVLFKGGGKPKCLHYILLCLTELIFTISADMEKNFNFLKFLLRKCYNSCSRICKIGFLHFVSSCTFASFFAFTKEYLAFAPQLLHSRWSAHLTKQFTGLFCSAEYKIRKKNS